MKYVYSWARPFLAALSFFIASEANAQQAWRPFRPGLIYAFKEAATSNASIYTLRVDSAYAAANGDSIYVFNRRLRTSTTLFPGGSLKSRNNLFGAQMRWRPGQSSYTLEALAQTNVQAAVSLELFPRAAVGSSWNASGQPLQTATLISRSLQTISPGVQDTVAVINIATAGGINTVRLSRLFGLLAGPQWLGGATGSALEQAQVPTRFENSLYSPVRLFDVQPGDEFGYEEYDLGMSPIRCYNSKMLRRVVSRRLTADSLIITYQEQHRYENFGYTGYCTTPAQVIYSPITLNRWALARTGNQWPTATGAGAVQLAALRLLTGEYVSATVMGAGGSSNLLAGLPISSDGFGGCPGSLQARISYTPYYLQPGNTPPVYRTGVDYAAWRFSFGPGVAITSEGPTLMGLIYYRKNVNGTTQTCGSPLAFVSLLPTRAAEAAVLATLHPNPAAAAATLTLAQPARAGHTLRLTDALGRTVWSAPLAAGQTTATVPLAGQPAGLYVLHLNGPNTGSSWKLLHE